MKDNVNNLTFGPFINLYKEDYEDYLKDYKHTIIEDFTNQDNMNEILNLVKLYLERDKKIGSENQINHEEDVELNYQIITVHVMMRIKKMSLFKYDEIKSYNDIINYKDKENAFWFRGQTDYSWKLVPSYYRSLGKKDLIVDHKYLENDYNDMGIKRKLNSIFGIEDIDYERLSFVQHSLAITPLLDFTKNVYSATSFAIGNYSSPRKLIDPDSAIFVLSIENKKIITSKKTASSVVDALNVEYIGSKPRIATLIKSLFWREFLIEALHSEYYLIDIKTNDRMRIQDGTFVLFNNVLFIGDDMIVSTKEHKVLSKIITKIKIKAKNKMSIYHDIMSNGSKYHLLKMMNPYDFMIE